MSIPGKATPQGTTQFKNKFTFDAPNAFRRLGRTDLNTSKMGFGTYRCHADVEEHAKALKKALHSGCNLIDTSANYTDGFAEVLIGDIINKETVWDDQITRENLIIVSKVGYIQGENMAIAQSKIAEKMPFEEVVEYQPGLWHCIHPQFIEDQITRSLARMHLDTLDVYLLHNPEYFLSDGIRRGIAVETLQKTFYDRIRRAFIQMEKLVDEGLIQHYGISSNSFPNASNSPEFVSLVEVWKAYQNACLQLGKTTEQGHFSVIQLPYNWVENGAITQKNNLFKNTEYTVLELAKELDLGILINRPLNAITENRLVRLSDNGFSEPQLAGSNNWQMVDQFKENFDAQFPNTKSKSTSQKALLTVTETPNVHVALNGMRTENYVDDAMGCMNVEF